MCAFKILVWLGYYAVLISASLSDMEVLFFITNLSFMVLPIATGLYSLGIYKLEKMTKPIPTINNIAPSDNYGRLEQLVNQRS